MSRTGSFITIIAGIFLILFGIVAFTTLAPMSTQLAIEKYILNLSPDSKFFKTYSSPKRNCGDLHIYLFEIMNSRDFLSGSKPKLRELGPFVFKTDIQRFNFSFSEDQKRLTYFQRYIYHFDPDQSFSDLNYLITTVNFPLSMILSRIDKMSSSGLLGIVQPMVKNFIKESLRNDGEHILERRTVGQILVGRKIDFIRRVQGYIDLAKSFGLRLGINLDKIKKIGYFRTTNNSVIGPITIKTGKRSFGAFLRDYSHHNNDKILLTLLNEDLNTKEYLSEPIENQFLEAYSDRGNRYYEQGQYGRCNERRGTDGTAFNVYAIREQRPLYLNTPFCRAMKLKFWNYTSATSNEPELANYVLEGDTFIYDRENWCYCDEARNQKLQWEAAKRYRGTRASRNRKRRVRITENNESLPVWDTRRCDGVYDYSQCQKNAAVYLSFPYFANAPGLASYIDGWNGKNGRTLSYSRTSNGISSRTAYKAYSNITFDDANDFEPQFSLHQGLGIPFKVRFQLQFNVKLTPSMTNGARRKSMYLPFLWFEQRFDLEDKLKNDVKLLDAVTSGVKLFCLGFSLVGFILMITGIMSCLKPSSKTKGDKIQTSRETVPEICKKTKNKVKELIDNRSSIQQLRIENLKFKKQDSGSNSSLADLIPRTESHDHHSNRLREYSLKNKKKNIKKQLQEKRAKLCSAQDKFHSVSESSKETLTPLD